MGGTSWLWKSRYRVLRWPANGREGLEEGYRPGLASRDVQATWNPKGGLVMFTASYPADFLPEANGKGYFVKFPGLPEALTSGVDLADARAEAVDCLAEALAGRISRLPSLVLLEPRLG